MVCLAGRGFLICLCHGGTQFTVQQLVTFQEVFDIVSKNNEDAVILILNGKFWDYFVIKKNCYTFLNMTSKFYESMKSFNYLSHVDGHKHSLNNLIHWRKSYCYGTHFYMFLWDTAERFEFVLWVLAVPYPRCQIIAQSWLLQEDTIMAMAEGKTPCL